MTEPISGAKLALSGATAISSSVDAATKPGGVVSRLMGLDMLRHDLKTLRKELDEFFTTLKIHHEKHEQSAQAIGMLLSQFRTMNEDVARRLSACEASIQLHTVHSDKLADARANAQDRALKDFERRLDQIQSSK